MRLPKKTRHEMDGCKFNINYETNEVTFKERYFKKFIYEHIDLYCRDVYFYDEKTSKYVVFIIEYENRTLKSYVCDNMTEEQKDFCDRLEEVIVDYALQYGFD